MATNNFEKLFLEGTLSGVNINTVVLREEMCCTGCVGCWGVWVAGLHGVCG